MKRKLSKEQYVTYTWKNGRGQSVRIAGDAADPFNWRISISRIESSGPFSNYTDYQRFLIPLTEGRLRLRHEGKQWIDVPRMHVHSFKGDWETEAACEKPIDDFNVMVRGNVEASVVAVMLAKGQATPLRIEGHRHYLYCVAGAFELGEQINAGDTLEVIQRGRLAPFKALTDRTEVIVVTLTGVK